MSHFARCFLLFALVCSASATADEWNPRATWVFAVGVLRFEGKAANDWPEKGRKDKVLLSTLRTRGVPADHILFLKNEQATLAALRREFPAFLERTAAGDTLLFYYAGHGSRDYSTPERRVSLIPYDRAGEWSLAEVLAAIDARFHGSRVLLTADCCHSGALAEEAAKVRRKMEIGVLTSARPSATSTGSWKFTESLNAIFAGEPLADLDHGGSISFAEAAQYCDLQMSLHEDQRSTGIALGPFPEDFTFTRVKGAPIPQLPEELEGLWKGKWYPARIISSHPGAYRVTWPGWDASYDSWLTPEELRPAGRNLFPAAARVEIKWGNAWYKGKVVRTALGLLLVHYEGYPESDDEWVPMERLRAIR